MNAQSEGLVDITKEVQDLRTKVNTLIRQMDILQEMVVQNSKGPKRRLKGYRFFMFLALVLGFWTFIAMAWWGSDLYSRLELWRFFAGVLAGIGLLRFLDHTVTAATETRWWLSETTLAILQRVRKRCFKGEGDKGGEDVSSVEKGTVL